MLVASALVFFALLIPAIPLIIVSNGFTPAPDTCAAETPPPEAVAPEPPADSIGFSPAYSRLPG